MALANKCDRCGAYYTQTKNPELKLIKSKGVASNMLVDLCPSCEEELKKFMCTDYTFNLKLAEFDEKHFGGPLEKEKEKDNV